jgi:hypothetical protein
MKLTKSFALLLLVTPVPLIAGCYPRPHAFYRSQEFAGKLVNGESPVTNATILVSNSRGDNGNYCNNVIATGTTDDAGGFRIQPVKEVHFFASLLNPPDRIYQGTAICFRVNNHEILGTVIVSSTDRATSHTMFCDLNQPPRMFKQGFVMPPEEWGICTDSI